MLVKQIKLVIKKKRVFVGTNQGEAAFQADAGATGRAGTRVGTRIHKQAVLKRMLLFCNAILHTVNRYL